MSLTPSIDVNTAATDAVDLLIHKVLQRATSKGNVSSR